MSLFDGLVALGVISGLGYIIYVKILSQNPGIGVKIKSIIPTKLYDKVEPITKVPDKIEQVWDERKSMM